MQVVDSLFGLAMPWWELVLRALAVYVVVLIMVRVVGKRTVGQYTPFDLVVVVLLGTAVQNSLIGRDESLIGGLILAATLLALNWMAGFASARSIRLSRVIEGAAIILARDGKVDREQLRRQSVSEEELTAACRANGCCDHAEIGLAILETSGEITVIKQKDLPAPHGTSKVHELDACDSPR